MFDQTNILFYLIFGIAGGITIFYLGYVSRRIAAEKKIRSAEERARAILDEARQKAEGRKKEADLEAKDLLFKMRQEFEKETRDRRQELITLERRLIGREENLEHKVEIIEKKDRELAARNKGVSAKEEELKVKNMELERVLAEEKQKLQNISGLTVNEAKRILMTKLEDEVKLEAALSIKKIEDEAREEADKKAREIVSLAIQRTAAEHTVESTVSVVSLPNDEMKGRIIGREGRNIRALEIATGIDVIIDDTPEAVILSGFDIVRREIARITLERLIQDGRIHPGRIEEIAEKVKREMDKTIQEEGERTALDLGVHGLNPEIVKLIGRLKYRTSYGQNALQHSKEVAYLMGVMASEMGMDFALARRIGLLHDIGKAMDHDVEGTHTRIGVDLAKKYGESPQVLHAIACHHQDMEAKTVYAVLVQAADAISGARPGARRETLESYVKRLENLESIADSFKGVEKTYAIQAGREVRVIVQPDKITDQEAIILARDIKKKIEEGMEYPGQIKVTVIRETRAIEYAK